MSAKNVKSQDNRHFPRQALQLAARYREKARQRYGQCIFMDISEKGVGILLQKEQLEVKDELQIQIKELVPKTIEASGTAVWTKRFQQLHGVQCAAGLMFKAMAEEDKQTLLYYLKKRFGKKQGK